MFGRVRYYGRFMDALAFLNDAQYNETFGKMGARAFVDVAATYRVSDKASVTVGAENVLNTYPDRLRGFLAASGLSYPMLRPYEADGGRYYVRLAANF